MPNADESLPDAAALERRILDLCASRGPEKTACPSEIARSLAPDAWRPLMEPVRQAGIALAKRGRLHITQGGKVLDPDALRGAIRFRIIPHDPG